VTPNEVIHGFSSAALFLCSVFLGVVVFSDVQRPVPCCTTLRNSGRSSGSELDDSKERRRRASANRETNNSPDDSNGLPASITTNLCEQHSMTNSRRATWSLDDKFPTNLRERHSLMTFRRTNHCEVRTLDEQTLDDELSTNEQRRNADGEQRWFIRSTFLISLCLVDASLCEAAFLSDTVTGARRGFRGCQLSVLAAHIRFAGYRERVILLLLCV